MFNVGDIISYHYLWARQAADQEESGRKARPVCLVVKTPDDPAQLFLFPLTRQNPIQGQDFLAISEIECRRAGLDFPTWIILDEYNRVRFDELYDLASTKALGSFSANFMRTIARHIRDIATTRRMKGVVRK